MGALNILNPFLHSDKYIMLLIRVLEISLEKPMSHNGLGNRFWRSNGVCHQEKCFSDTRRGLSVEAFIVLNAYLYFEGA